MKNVPNYICWFRIAMIPFVLLFLLPNGITAGLSDDIRILISGILFGVAMLSDILDGKIARKYNLISDFGKVLDQIADKVLVSSVLIAFVADGYVSSLPVILILAREFLVSGLRMGVAAKGAIIAANLWGKIKTTSQGICIGITFLILFLDALTQREVVSPLPNILFWIVAGYTVFSVIPYYIQCKKYLKEE